MSVHRRWFSLPREPSTVAAGRRRVRELLASWGTPLDEDTRFTLDLVTSELLGNAVRHATGPAVTVGVPADPLHNRAVIEVYDSSPGLPALPGHPDEDAESGRGLLIVTQLALAHGVVRKRGGKWVWAEIALPGAVSHRRTGRTATAPADGTAGRIGAQRRAPLDGLTTRATTCP